MNKYNIDFFYMHLVTMRCQCVLNRSSNQDAHCLIKQHYLEKNWWNELIWVTEHCNRAAVSRNRYGDETLGRRNNMKKRYINELLWHISLFGCIFVFNRNHLPWCQLELVDILFYFISLSQC
jgi:hypothetical protein